jgi:hypothetical protein
MSDREFADGLYVKEPWPNSPDWVKFRININKDRLIPWLQATQTEGGWINMEVKLNQKGEWYADVQRGKGAKLVQQPAAQQEPEVDDDIPF